MPPAECGPLLLNGGGPSPEEILIRRVTLCFATNRVAFYSVGEDSDGSITPRGREATRGDSSGNGRQVFCVG